MTPDVADEVFAEQLELYIVNTREIYEKHYVPVAKNLARKRYGGIYNVEKAIKAMGYIVGAGLKGYQKEVPDAPRQVCKATKELTARELLEGMQELINDEVRNIAEKTKRRTPEQKAARPMVKEVIISRAEGPKELADGKPHSFRSMAAASEYLRSQAFTFPKTGGYDKHDLKVIWDDGETYEGRLDCKGLGLPDNDLDVKKHIVDFLKGVIRVHKEHPEVFSAKNAKDAAVFLGKYMEAAV